MYWSDRNTDNMPGCSGISSRQRGNIRQQFLATKGSSVGQHLSTTTLQLKYDPLNLDAFITSSEKINPLLEEVNHFPGFEDLTPLIFDSYMHCSASSYNFQLSISLGMYSYYIAVLSWARFLYLKNQNIYQLTDAEGEFVDMIYKQTDYKLPKSIIVYLSGFANFITPSGVESKFNLKSYEYDDLGYFKNLDLCAFYPSISIYAERIMRDIAYTDKRDRVCEWSLHKTETKWDPLSMGYAPASKLSFDQRQLLSNLNVRSDAFTFDITLIRVSVGLMNSVERYLLKVPKLEFGPLPKNLIALTQKIKKQY